MTVVTISRGSYSMGKEVAERLALRLGFECLSRDVLLEASEKFNIPEIKLVKAFIDTPSILNSVTHGQQNYIAYIQCALTRHVCKDDIVYHGLAGHVLLKNVPHVLKVCITADFKHRVETLMEREHVSEREAKSWINKVDKERRKWTKTLYGVDPWEPGLYDLLINIGKFEVDDAVDLIFQSARIPTFQTTDESRHKMMDLALACEVRAKLVSDFPDVKVTSTYGNVLLYTHSGDHHLKKLHRRAKKLRTEMDSINDIEVHAGVSTPEHAV
jgi:cytidylate kinase